MPAAQHRPSWSTCTASAGERPPGAELPELEAQRAAGHRPAAGRSCWPRPRAAPARNARRRRWLARASGCPRRRAAARRSEGADEGEIAVRSHVHDVDQVGGVAPGREPLDGDITILVSLATIDDLDAHPVRVEGAVSGKRVKAVRRPDDPPRDVAPVGADRIGHVPRRCRRPRELPDGARRGVDAQELDLSSHGHEKRRTSSWNSSSRCRPAESRTWPAHPPPRRTDTSRTRQPCRPPPCRAHGRG